MSLATASVRALGTTALVAVTEPRALPAARRLLVRDLRALDLACSRFRHDSELAALNRAAGAAWPASGLLREAVRGALRAAEITGGLVDPTVGRALRLAGYDRTFARLELRDGRVFRPVFERAGHWQAVQVDDAAGTVQVPPDVELDLGATAKALAADRIAANVARETGAGVLVSIGGDVAVAGEPPEDGWSVGIADDHRARPEEISSCVAVRSGGLATSGTRSRRWCTAAGELHHILDPRSGRPVDSPWTTVSVAAATCHDANAGSTAAILLGDAAPSWLAVRQLPARLRSFDGEIVVVAGWPGDRGTRPDERAAA
jgi:thiamine biosynthesis lipoprotein